MKRKGTYRGYNWELDYIMGQPYYMIYKPGEPTLGGSSSYKDFIDEHIRCAKGQHRWYKPKDGKPERCMSCVRLRSKVEAT